MEHAVTTQLTWKADKECRIRTIEQQPKMAPRSKRRNYEMGF